ncbi:cysteine synthase A [Sedimentibacter hydroxybenzoicus DSM 7310]|uniref:Cysteine synthase n=1 Tax=Sedimentibacter hydroxybenzoicus DSM 7310 TaxID=1123245 RepID=A0A974GX18_SEDHY|nr:cysteine synthase A [Sedimentibacter hydroxybenzoicus]NYB75053.1 cysteine synthase A [Sedimentibacter hydroxybenzoicus DSM 7310]
MKQFTTLNLIGNTPVVQLPGENIFIKMEKFNPGGSIKDRTALGMILDAEKKGLLQKDSVIVEPTSGNTGIALALIGRLKGYKVILTMPETMSVERRTMISSYGATLVLTEGPKGMKGAIERANEILKENSKNFMPDQFNNPANPEFHYMTTAEEIIKQLNDLDIFTAGVGTGGTITGVSKRLKEYNKNIKIAGVEPEKSPVISGGNPGPHKIQGIGAGFIPNTYNGENVDEILTITEEEAIDTAVEVSAKTGILVGISSGANVAAARKLAVKYGNNKKILTIAPDGGEKYLSMVKYY